MLILREFLYVKNITFIFHKINVSKKFIHIVKIILINVYKKLNCGIILLTVKGRVEIKTVKRDD